LTQIGLKTNHLATLIVGTLHTYTLVSDCPHIHSLAIEINIFLLLANNDFEMITSWWQFSAFKGQEFGLITA
jgi:hypothetical protein